ncbi:golgi pH regulator [Geosmithia morbida]|uniref:Golgi pH regulator n=1 Tax=Geosmithia morbida TaxID=1094350 RepID=A0A9P4YNT0_9HYPO|nr:golgi pH regulator [Geosmithia morbida]KAF4120366.1 golgi pH regulator [Geosmithia morbida]
MSPVHVQITTASLVPFAAILAITYMGATRHILPRLSRSHDESLDGEEHVLPHHAPEALRQAHAQHGARSGARILTERLFGVTLALASALAALILAEILGVADPTARTLALGWTVRSLLVLLVAVLPWMECGSLLSAAGWRFRRGSGGRAPGTARTLQTVLFVLWLVVFGIIGGVVPDGGGGGPVTAAEIAATSSSSSSAARKQLRGDGRMGIVALVDMLTTACLERVGVVGICLMALLAGSAAVSTPWYTFGDARRRGRRGPLTDADIARREEGLDAVREMLTAKRHRMQALSRRAAESAGTAAPPAKKTGFIRSMMRGGGKSGADEGEVRSLRVEIAGLEAMEANLASSLTAARGQMDAEQRSSTRLGRALLAPKYVFCCYCLYRILATWVTTFRRITSSSPPPSPSSPSSYSYSLPTSLFNDGGGGGSSSSSSSSSSFSSTDPINRFLGLAARHWDPNLDQIAWSRTFSFLLSGVMLLLSASSVVQTLGLFSRWAPPVIQRRAQASLALAVGHVAATYVISSALLLRSHLPLEVSSDVTGALLARGPATGGNVISDAPPIMTPAFADGWFEAWFLVGAAVTALGIWIGRTVAGPEEDDYDHEVGQKRL